jgi:hypothetical protein
MLTKKTVFVLGAGASVPFGFPIGAELSSQIVTALNPGNQAFNVFQHLSLFTESEITTFRETFFFSGKNSIDAFLEHRPEFMAIGKAAIAAVLIPYEYDRSVFGYPNDNWLRYTFNQLITTFEEFAENKLSFVTFNYDRVVEHFFFTSLLNSYGRTEDDCRSVLERIPVVHLHGRLGYLPWQQTESRPFAQVIDKSTIEQCMRHIKIIHEDIRDGRDAEFTEAKRLLAEAERIYFMGFGFNRTNVERLDLANLPPGKTIYSTSIGFTPPEIAVVARLTNSKVSFQVPDCISMCRERIDWS